MGDDLVATAEVLQITREQFNAGMREASKYRERPMDKSSRKPSTKPADAMGTAGSKRAGSNN